MHAQVTCRDRFCHRHFVVNGAIVGREPDFLTGCGNAGRERFFLIVSAIFIAAAIRDQKFDRALRRIDSDIDLATVAICFSKHKAIRDPGLARYFGA